MASKIDLEPEIQAKADTGISSSSTEGSDVGLPVLEDGHGNREAFLASFSADENKRIMRKVDRKFLFIIGMMYILKNVRESTAQCQRGSVRADTVPQIDYQNAAYAKARLFFVNFLSGSC